MGQIIGNLIAQFREFYKTLSPTKRVSMIGASVIGLVGGFIILFMISGSDYVPLLRNVTSEKLGLVVDQLKGKNIPFRLADDGRTVKIPRELLHSTQMAIMSELGTESLGTMGFEIFDKQEFGTTSYTQRINYQRALQGELMRAIVTLEAVKRAKVILALPAKKTFLEEGGKPSASIVIDLHIGKKLSEEQVRGIKYLVSSSVENLEQEDVTIVDGRGKILTRSTGKLGAATSELHEMKAKVEGVFEERIESMLSKVVGQAKVIAKVDATLNAKQLSTLEELVDADKSAIRSTQVEEETLNGARTNPAGVPGARANIPGAADAGQVGFNQNVKKELKTTNYTVPKTVKNIREAPGSIERLSVAVLVDGIYKEVKKEDGTIERVYEPRQQEELEKYINLVKSSIGFNEKRGDIVKIENLKFSTEDFDEAEKLLTTLERKKLLYALFKWILLGFSLGLFFFIVIRPFMQWITDSFQDSVDDMLPRTIEELEELQSVDNTLPGMASALPTLEQSIDPHKAESELLKDRIMTLVEKDPERAVAAFNLWLAKREL